MGSSIVAMEVATMIKEKVTPDVPVCKSANCAEWRGFLRASGTVVPMVSSGMFSEADIIYASYNPHDGYNYAAIQHEVAFSHEWGGKDHYLSDVMEQDAGEIAALAGAAWGRML